MKNLSLIIFFLIQFSTGTIFGQRAEEKIIEFETNGIKVILKPSLKEVVST